MSSSTCNHLRRPQPARDTLPASPAAAFAERFQGLPVNIAHASRLVGSKALSEAKAGIKDGSVDIIIGTHALLGKAINFKRLGLLVIDEEQRFGVKHKERLKELKTDVHVLTLSATPIPRTLQLALTGSSPGMATIEAVSMPSAAAAEDH